jgi:hypothetical protein
MAETASRFVRTGEKRIVRELSVGCVAALVAVTCLLGAIGCARVGGRSGDAREETAAPVSADVDAEFKVVRRLMRDVLRDSPVEIYTRDERGIYVVFADVRRAFFTPRRLRLVITIRPLAENRSRVTIETFPEAYTVQLLTSPAWRPAAFGDNSLAREILDSLQRRINHAAP